MNVDGVPQRTVRWEGGAVVLIDQRRLPWRFELVSCGTVDETAADD